MIELASADYRLVLEPERGGSVAAFEWKGEPLFRPTCGPSILDTACFPLVPFSNRIAFGRFERPDGVVQLRPNFPGSDHPHAIHGFGWLAPWDVVEADGDRAVLRHTYEADEWPWSYVAVQRLRLSDQGLVHELTLTNLSDRSMPAGLGFHPYFPRTDQTLYHGLHKGEWQSAHDGLPIQLMQAPQPLDWWRAQPVHERVVDTVYTGRAGPLSIQWPERRLQLTMTPTDNLGCTVVYTPNLQDYFCVEPVTHTTNTINNPQGGGMHWLQAGASLTVGIACRAGVPPSCI
jgi:aldose 1-epimerase